MTILLDYEKEELYNLFANLNLPKYRIDQLLNAMYSGKDYGDNINLPKDFLLDLENKGYILQPIKIRKAISSGNKDKTTKFLYDLHDGNIIEGVLMKYAFGNTLCISTQVGCKMNCAFCASGLNGFVRNLSAGEIIGQIVAVNKYLGGSLKDRKITNVVLMGSGEPLDNFDNVKKFLKIITSSDCFDFSVRNISVSTCGIPSKIEELADLGFAVTLCFSLHASNDATRREIMPIAKRYSIAEVIEALHYYHTVTNRRIIIEYTLIDGVNNSMTNAKELSILLKNLPCHVNLIKLNEVEGRNLKTPTSESCKKFLDNLNRFGVSATMRRSLGDDIEGACGMLRNKELVGGEVVIKTRKKNTTNSRPLPNKNTLSKVKDPSKLINSKKNSDKDNFSRDKKTNRVLGKSKSFDNRNSRNNTNKMIANNQNKKSSNAGRKNYK